jgi:hypothetical protein
MSTPVSTSTFKSKNAANGLANLLVSTRAPVARTDAVLFNRTVPVVTPTLAKLIEAALTVAANNKVIKNNIAFFMKISFLFPLLGI